MPRKEQQEEHSIFFSRPIKMVWTNIILIGAIVYYFIPNKGTVKSIIYMTLCICSNDL